MWSRMHKADPQLTSNVVDIHFVWLCRLVHWSVYVGHISSYSDGGLVYFEVVYEKHKTFSSECKHVHIIKVAGI